MGIDLKIVGRWLRARRSDGVAEIQGCCVICVEFTLESSHKHHSAME